MSQDPPDLGEFLESKGALSLLLEIDISDGNKFRELEEKVNVSESTLSKRALAARQLGLVGVTRLKDDHGNAKRYRLQLEGAGLRLAMESLGIADAYKRLREAQSDLDEGVENMQEWLEEVQKNNNGDHTSALTEDGYPGTETDDLNDPEDELDSHYERMRNMDEGRDI